VIRFASAKDLRAGKPRLSGARLLAAGDELVHAPRRTGSAGSRRGSPYPGAPPRRHRAGRCSWPRSRRSTSYSLCSTSVEPFALPLPLRLAIVAAAVTALMTWLVMPRAARLLQRYDSRVAFIRDSAGRAAVAARSRSRSVLRLLIGSERLSATRQPSGWRPRGARRPSIGLRPTWTASALLAPPAKLPVS
jgi:hypothetical protein